MLLSFLICRDETRESRRSIASFDAIKNIKSKIERYFYKLIFRHLFLSIWSKHNIFVWRPDCILELRIHYQTNVFFNVFLKFFFLFSEVEKNYETIRNNNKNEFAKKRKKSEIGCLLGNEDDIICCTCCTHISELHCSSR